MRSIALHDNKQSLDVVFRYIKGDFIIYYDANFNAKIYILYSFDIIRHFLDDAIWGIGRTFKSKYRTLFWMLQLHLPSCVYNLCNTYHHYI